MTSPGFRFAPDTAASVAAATKGLANGVTGLSDLANQLSSADGSGNFTSGRAIDAALGEIGKFAKVAADRLRQAVNDYLRSVVDAGELIPQQDSDNRDLIARAGQGGSSSLPVNSSSLHPTPVPAGPNPLDILTSGMTSNLPGLPSADGNAAGKFACPA